MGFKTDILILLQDHHLTIFTNMEFCLVCHGFRMMMKNELPDILQWRFRENLGVWFGRVVNGTKLLFPKYKTLISDTSEQTTLTLIGFGFSTDYGRQCVKITALSLLTVLIHLWFVHRHLYVASFVRSLRLR